VRDTAFRRAKRRRLTPVLGISFSGLRPCYLQAKTPWPGIGGCPSKAPTRLTAPRET
jgi:hypothetical protein